MFILSNIILTESNNICTTLLVNTCNFFWYILKFGNKLYAKEFLNISEEYRKVLELLDEHLKHYVLSENKYLLELGKENKLVFNYVDTEIFEKYLQYFYHITISIRGSEKGMK